MVAKLRIHSPAGERQVSHRPARAMKRHFANVNCMDLYSGRRLHGAYLVRLNSSDPLSGPPTLAIPDPAASSQTLARIGPNGPNVCCSDVKPSAYGPYGVSIGFWSRIGKSLSRFAFCGLFWLMMWAATSYASSSLRARHEINAQFGG